RRHRPLSDDTLLARLHYRRASARLRTGLHVAAIIDLDQAISLKPNDARPYLQKGLALLQINDFVEASRTLLIGSRLTPTDGRLSKRFVVSLEGIRHAWQAYRSGSHS
ncbi:unnamed protein product, partial [Phaeothamnion confervicola]